MNYWILFSLLAAFVWAITNVLDKYLLSKWVKDPMILLITFGITGFFAALGIYLFKGYVSISPQITIVALGAGVVYFLANLLYYRAVETEEISIVIPLIYLDSLFTAALSALLINEVLSGVQYLAVLMLIIGAIVISFQPGRRFRITVGVWLCIAAAFVYGINNLLNKYALNTGDWWTIFSYVRIGTFVCVVPMICQRRKALQNILSKQRKVLGALTLNGVLGISGVLFFTIALSLGYATLTTSLTALQPLFVLVIASLVSIFWPQAINEAVSKRIFIQKLLAVILMFIGVMLIIRT